MPRIIITMNIRRKHEVGAVNGSIFAIIALVILVLVFGSFSIWAYVNYMDQKTDVDGKITEASAKAVLENSQKLQTEFEKKEKQPILFYWIPI